MTVCETGAVVVFPLWRTDGIPYGDGTRNATRAAIEAAAREIYADYPEKFEALGL